MKNDSFLFPFGIPGDSLFDWDFDGQLTGLETSFRDAIIISALEYLLSDDETDKNDTNYDDFF